MKRREFLGIGSIGLLSATVGSGRSGELLGSVASPRIAEEQFHKPKDFKKDPFRRLVILGESTVEGGPWLHRKEDRYADVLVRLIDACQEEPIQYINKGIGNNAISPRSPGYEQSAKPSALERYHKDVIAHKPDLFILAYGLNDMRAGMPVDHFHQDMSTIVRDVKKNCSPTIVLTTVYYMTAFGSYEPLNKGGIGLTSEYNKSIYSLAEEFDCVVADLWASEGGADWLVHYDGVHANMVGNLVIGHKLFETIAQHCSCLTLKAFAEERNTKWTEWTTSRREKTGDPFKKTW